MAAGADTVDINMGCPKKITKMVDLLCCVNQKQLRRSCSGGGGCASHGQNSQAGQLTKEINWTLPSAWSAGAQMITHGRTRSGSLVGSAKWEWIGVLRKFTYSVANGDIFLCCGGKMSEQTGTDK